MEGVNLHELHTDKSNSLVDLVSEAASKLVIAPDAEPVLHARPRSP